MATPQLRSLPFAHLARFQPAGVSRRRLLQGAGLLAAAAGLSGSPVRAEGKVRGQPMRFLRSSQTVPRRPAAPTLPPLNVIALNRMAFGPRPGDLAAFDALGATPQARLAAYVEQQLDPAAIDDSPLQQRMAAQTFLTLDKSLSQLWQDHLVNYNAPPPEYAQNQWGYRMLPAIETERLAFLRAVYSRRQLQELLADFWHNHFNVYGWDGWIAPVFVHYDRDVIRRHMLGNFRELLEAVATSPAMLYYLDNRTNSRAGPNENWARELFELHTMGADSYRGIGRQRDVPGFFEEAPVGYVDDDVYEATRCFTGWRVNDSTWEAGVQNTGTFLYYEGWHDRFQKTVLGRFFPADQAPMADGRAVLDLVADHPATARHIAQKLCRRFIADDPPAAAVAAAAATFTAQRRAPDQLKQVVRSVLLSPEFQSSWGEKIKRPFEYAVSLLRATEADFVPRDSFFWLYDSGGQGLYEWRAPDGYPDRRAAWSGTMPMLQRWRLCGALLESWFDGTTIDIRGQTPPHLRTPNALVDFWIDRILGRPLPAFDRQQAVELLALGRNPDYELTQAQIDDRLRHVVGLLLMVPDFLWR